MSPVAVARLLDIYAARTLWMFWQEWQEREPSAQAVAVRFAELTDRAARGKPGRVRPALTDLIELGLLESAGKWSGARGHPINLYRVTPFGEAVAAAMATEPSSTGRGISDSTIRTRNIC